MRAVAGASGKNRGLVAAKRKSGVTVKWLRDGKDAETDASNKHGTFIAWTDLEVPLELSRVAALHDCPEDTLTVEEMDEETLKAMRKAGKQPGAAREYLDARQEELTQGLTAAGAPSARCGSRRTRAATG